MKDMRITIVLVLIAISMAFATGYYALFIQGNYSVSSDDIFRIKNLKKEFRKKHEPVLIINFNSLYSSRAHLELLKPLSQIGSAGLRDKGILYSSSKDCFKDIYNIANSVNFEKVVLWEEFRCNRRKKLPSQFFSMPPYLHPSGKSYAYLAYETKKNPFISQRWIEEHYQYFHLSELKKISQLKHMPSYFNVLSQLEGDVLNGLVKGDDSLITNEFYLEKNRDIFVFFDLEYKVYPVSLLKDFIENSPYRIKKYDKNLRCLYKDGNICWRFDVVHILSATNKRNVFIIVISIILILILVYFLYVKLKAQRLEDNKRRLALQVLTHEFRTPVTSLLLSAEEAQKKFEEFDEESQEILLRLSSDIHRLYRLVEASRNYLKLDQGKKLITFQNREISSVNHFFEYILSPYLDDITFSPLGNDKAFYLDEYWVSICVKNLVENALKHGSHPVELKLSAANAAELRIDVIDSGEAAFEKLSEVTGEFVKGNKSEGSGLGLNIVKKVLQDMKAQFLFKKNPTTFSIILKEAK